MSGTFWTSASRIFLPTFSRLRSTDERRPASRSFVVERLGVGLVALGDRQDDDLDGGQPQGEAPVVVLDEDAEEALEGAEQGPVDHVGPVLLAVLADVGHVEALGHVEIELDGRALPEPADGVLDLDVDLGTVEDGLALHPLVGHSRGSPGP